MFQEYPAGVSRGPEWKGLGAFRLESMGHVGWVGQGQTTCDSGGHAQVWFFILETVRRGDEIWLKPLWFHSGEKLGELEEAKCDQFELSRGQLSWSRGEGPGVGDNNGEERSDWIPEGYRRRDPVYGLFALWQGHHDCYNVHIIARSLID